MLSNDIIDEASKTERSYNTQDDEAADKDKGKKDGDGKATRKKKKKKFKKVVHGGRLVQLEDRHGKINHVQMNRNLPADLSLCNLGVFNRSQMEVILRRNLRLNRVLVDQGCQTEQIDQKYMCIRHHRDTPSTDLEPKQDARKAAMLAAQQNGPCEETLKRVARLQISN